jgi:hypothetical protein
MKQYLVGWTEPLDPVENIRVLFTDSFSEWKKRMENRGCFLSIIVPLTKAEAMKQNCQHMIF